MVTESMKLQTVVCIQCSIEASRMSVYIYNIYRNTYYSNCIHSLICMMLDLWQMDKVAEDF